VVPADWEGWVLLGVTGEGGIIPMPVITDEKKKSEISLTSFRYFVFIRVSPRAKEK
jgi:hypothetical protein